MTDPSGLLQLGHRFYWPEIGRFIQQDPIGSGVNWYAYAGNNPVVWIDPEGLRFRDWYMGGMGGASEFVDNYILGGSTADFGDTAGRYDAGCASLGEVAVAGAQWGGRVGATAYVGGQTVAAVGRATAMSGPVTHFGPRGMSSLRPGDWVITGNRGPLNRILSLRPAYPSSITTSAAPGTLRVPGGPLGPVHRILGHRIYAP